MKINFQFRIFIKLEMCRNKESKIYRKRILNCEKKSFHL